MSRPFLSFAAGLMLGSCIRFALNHDLLWAALNLAGAIWLFAAKKPVSA